MTAMTLTTSAIMLALLLDRSESLALKKDSDEMLVPLNSSTALLCNPLINQDEGKATWYKDGHAIGIVDKDSNTIIGDSGFDRRAPMPKVGFLIIAKMRFGDEGDYHCGHLGTGELGMTTTLRAAYPPSYLSGAVPQLSTFTLNPHSMAVLLECPEASGVPRPSTTWLLNSSLIELSVGGKLHLMQNGSLLIRNFREEVDGGIYECIASNFLGKASLRVRVPASWTHGISHEVERSRYDVYEPLAIALPLLISRVKSAIFWMLVGSLGLCCLILLYLIIGMISHMCTRAKSARDLVLADNTEERDKPSLLYALLRVEPNLAPGFRKSIVPMDANSAGMQRPFQDGDGSAT